MRITQVDAFTDRPFAGNPAAVCVLDAPRPDAWMQSVAQEMNLSALAFLHPTGDAYHLRWFTPAVEINLCGHATLASAHVLWEEGHLAPEQVAQFDTRSGRLTATRENGWITLDFPAKVAQPAEPPSGLVEGLGVQPRNVVRNIFDYLIEVDSIGTVRALQPDFSRLAAVDMRGVIVTAPADGKPYDFVSRFFAPAAGINEDPVTGSAHCALGPYWAERLGRSDLLAYQASRRGGSLRVGVRGERVLLSGHAVTILRADLLA